MTGSAEKVKEILKEHLEHVTFHLPPPTMEGLYKVCEEAGEAILSKKTELSHIDDSIERCHQDLYIFARDLLNTEPSLTSVLKSDVGGDDGTCEVLNRFLADVLTFDGELTPGPQV